MHSETYSSLRSSSVKLLNSLSCQEDAVMLQLRVDEMDQRWHHLKTKCVDVRYVFLFIKLLKYSPYTSYAKYLFTYSKSFYLGLALLVNKRHIFLSILVCQLIQI